MIFVDANIFIYLVGRSHPLRERARAMVIQAAKRGVSLVTSAEVLQELLHYYRRRRREETLADAFAQVAHTVREVWSVEEADVQLARELGDAHPGLEARDLVHLACCLRRGAAELFTYDRALALAWARRGSEAQGGTRGPDLSP